MSATTDLPVSFKERLLELAKRLPAAGQAPFVKASANRLGQLALQHETTIVYGAIGFLLGELLDNYLTISVPFSEIVICLTGDHASTAIGAGSALVGLWRDIQKNDIRKQVAEILGTELKAALVRAH